MSASRGRTDIDQWRFDVCFGPTTEVDQVRHKLKKLPVKVLSNFTYDHVMRKIAIALLVGVFTGLLAYVSTDLLEWYRTGQLAVHKKPVLGGPDVLTYSGGPIGFTIEFELYLFLFTMGALGVLMGIERHSTRSPWLAISRRFANSL
jgi:hypothetical protein